MLNSSPKHLVLASDAWYGVAHGCTRKLGMKICGKFCSNAYTALLTLFQFKKRHRVTQGVKMGVLLRALCCSFDPCVKHVDAYISK